MSDPVIVTCAVSGSIITGNPNQPQTRDEVIAEVVAARGAGAAVVHVHARTEHGEMSQAPEDYLAIKDAVRAQVDDVILNFTTGGALGMPPEQRRQSLQAQPDVASLNCGSLNFGPQGVLFHNPKELIDDLAAEMERRGIVPEYECFDFGMAVTARAIAQAATGPPGIMHLVLGVVGGAPATVDSVTMFARMVPDGVPWMVTAVGRDNFPIMATTIALGGHVRTGLEDVVYMAAGEYAASNAALVRRAVALAGAIGRPVATPSEARALLGAPPASDLQLSPTTMHPGTRG
jgi:3-keto-5-aminohexanoate cleavage enzyme